MFGPRKWTLVIWLLLLVMLILSLGAWRLFQSKIPTTKLSENEDSQLMSQAKPRASTSPGSVRIQRSRAVGNGSDSTSETIRESPLESCHDTQSEVQSISDTPQNVEGKDIDIAEFDRRANNGLVPLSMVAIPVPYPSGGGGAQLQLTEADRQRLFEIESQVAKWIEGKEIQEIPADGYQPIRLSDRKTVYVRRNLVGPYQRLLEEDDVIHARNMRPTSSSLWHYEPRKSLGSPDGTRVEYYRRRDGALVRAVKKSNGQVSKSVIGWASADPARYGIPPHIMQHVIERHWREE